MGLAETWDATFETVPSGSRDPSLGDDDIRAFKVAVRERLEREHIASVTDTNANHGWHREGSAIVYYGTTAPTTRPDGVTSLDTLDKGRIWVDTSSSKFAAKFWDGSAWQNVNYGPGGFSVATGQYFSGGPKAKSATILGTVVQSTAFSTLSPFLPGTGDTALVVGIITSTNGSGTGLAFFIPYYIERTSSTVITLYGCKVTGTTSTVYGTITISSTGVNHVGQNGSFSIGGNGYAAFSI